MSNLRNLQRRVNRARNFPHNTCPASRHLHMMADCLAKGKRYHMFEEEPEHCAETLLSVLESLWKLRTEAGWDHTATIPAQNCAGDASKSAEV